MKTATSLPALGSGPDTIVVNASATLAAGVGAHFNLVVDGTTVGNATVGTALQGFTFQTTLATGQAHDIQIVYDNDTVVNGQDRNLSLQSIVVNGQVIAATDSTETYRPVGQNPIARSGNMVWSGIADFALPAAYFPSPLPPPTSGTGPDTIVVNASATLAAGIGAHFNLVVDGTVVGNATVGTALQGYTFKTTLATGQTHDIQIVYDNDAVVNGQDRNLSLQSIVVNGQVVAATDSHETYRPVGQNPIAGSGNMVWAGAADFALPASYFPAPTPPGPGTGTAFYVSSSGSDSGDGSAAHPFATLARAKLAMEQSSVRTTYVGNGTYNLTAPLVLTSIDNGMSFLAAAGAKPVLNASTSNLINLIALNGTQNVTLQGLTFQNTLTGFSNAAVFLTNATANHIVGNLFIRNDRGIALSGSNSNIISGNEIDNSSAAGVDVGLGSNRNTIDSNLINGTSLSGTGTGSAGIFFTGGNYNTITHNLVQNTAGAGIALENWDTSGNPLNLNIGNTIAYNSVVKANSSPQATDSGAIYIVGRAGANTQTIINNNYVNNATTPLTGLSDGVYLDDFTSGVSVTNNIITGGNFSFQIHGGQNNSFSNNIFDMGSRSASNIGAGLVQSAFGGPFSSMSGDSITGNIIFSTATIPPVVFISYGGTASVSNNLYYNTNGQTMTTVAPLQDSNPRSGNPLFANEPAGNYALGSGSAASAIGFQQINQSQIGLAPTTAHWY